MTWNPAWERYVDVMSPAHVVAGTDLPCLTPCSIMAHVSGSSLMPFMVTCRPCRAVLGDEEKDHGQWVIQSEERDLLRHHTRLVVYTEQHGRRLLSAIRVCRPRLLPLPRSFLLSNVDVNCLTCLAQTRTR